MNLNKKIQIKLNRDQMIEMIQLLGDRSLFEDDDDFLITWTMRYKLAIKINHQRLLGKQSIKISLDISQAAMITKLSMTHDVEDYLLILNEINEIKRFVGDYEIKNIRKMIAEE